MLDLEAIKARWAAWRDWEESSQMETMMDTDIPALMHEVERLRATVAGYRLDMSVLGAEVERLRAQNERLRVQVLALYGTVCTQKRWRDRWSVIDRKTQELLKEMAHES